MLTVKIWVASCSLARGSCRSTKKRAKSSYLQITPHIALLSNRRINSENKYITLHKKIYLRFWYISTSSRLTKHSIDGGRSMPAQLWDTSANLSKQQLITYMFFPCSKRISEITELCYSSWDILCPADTAMKFVHEIDLSDRGIKFWIWVIGHCT